jgi:hypothetical protein
MEMAQTRETSTCNLPKSYSLNMFKDFVPMCVFSENGQGMKQIHSSSAFQCFMNVFSYHSSVLTDVHGLSFPCGSAYTFALT